MKLAQLLRFAGGSGSGKNKISEPVQDWRWKVSGLNLKDMKTHYAIVPMFGFTFLAMGLAAGYVYRLATKHPEVSWTKKNPEPWNDYRNKQYKFVDSGRDYSKGTPAPTYKP